MAKRKVSTKRSGNKILIIATAIVALLALYIWFTYSARRKVVDGRFALYPDYGIELPLGL
jgi:hypothetical protein